MRSTIIFLAAAIGCAITVSAQTPTQGATLKKVVKGMVHAMPDMQTLNGATVRWKGTSKGTYTDADGMFSIERVEETDTLQISYVGYTALDVVADRDMLHIMLEPTTQDVVVVTEDESTITNVTQRTETVTRKELTRAACCSLAESFERSPSVEVAFSDAVSGARTIRVLGLRGQYTQLLTEAVPLKRAVETPFGMEHIPGPFMESINISKGAGTVSNGYDGMVGAINVWMQDPFEAPLLYVNAYGNTMSRFEGNVYSGGMISPELATVTMVHARTRQTDIDNNGDGFQDSPKMQQFNAVQKLHYNNDEIEWQLFVNGLVDSYASGQLADSVKPGEQRYRLTTDIERLEAFMKFGLLDVFYDLDQSSLAFIVSGAMHNANSIFGERVIDARERQFDAKAILTTTFSDALFMNNGLSFRYDNVRETFWRNDTTNTVFDRIERVPGVYSEATWTPMDDLTVVGGLRYDWHNLYGSFFTPRMHAKLTLGSLTFIRASAGRGWRAPTVLSENLSTYVNNRNVFFDPAFRAEESWNYGASFTTTITIADRPYVFDAEIYRTDFQNKVIIDYDRSVRDVYITNLDGNAYSTSIMAQIQATPFKRFDVTVAWRWLDVQAPQNGVMQLVPMLSRHRALMTLAWENDVWQVDGTITYFSSGRLPTTEGNPEAYQRPLTFPGYWRVNSQVTYKMPSFDIYVGSENMTNFIQQDPIIAAEDPFGQHFDASLAWGPTSPWMIYLGVRYTL
jgi:outer membrane receptor for ferrienterochelin and colicins